MTEDENWPHSFLAWHLHNQYLHMQLMAESFILNLGSEDYQHLFKRACNSTLLSDMREEINELKQAIPFAQLALLAPAPLANRSR
jgi:hypothetical protein